MSTCDHSNPLHIAAENKEFEEVKRLLEVEKVNVNVRDPSCSITALHLATEKGSLEIVQLLLEHNANINAIMQKGFTPLHISLQWEHAHVAEYLIQCGADVNIADDFGCTPLHNLANRGCSLKVAMDLIDKGINVNAKENSDRTALHYAAESNFHEIASCLIEHGAAIDATCDNNWTALHLAAYKGSIEVANLLMEKGANTNSETKQLTTPLHFAVDQHHVAMAELLLKYGAKIHALDDTDSTPLHVAAENGNTEIVVLLLNHEADSNAIDNIEKATPLHNACQRGYLDIIKHLIAKGANVNAKLDKNIIPLHLAVVGNHINVLQLLLANGAYYDSEVEGLPNSTPVDFAICKENLEAMNRLSLIDTLFIAILENDSSAVDHCIRMGVAIDCKSVEFESPLLYVAKMGNIKILTSFLKQQGVNVNITNEDNFTPLHYAAKNRHFRIVCVLLQHGAMFNIQSKIQCKTPLDFANDPDTTNVLKFTTELFGEMRSDKDKVIQKLIALSQQNHNVILAVMNARNKDGRTLMQIALINNHKDIANMILIELQLTTSLESKLLD